MLPFLYHVSVSVSHILVHTVSVSVSCILVHPVLYQCHVFWCTLYQYQYHVFWYTLYQYTYQVLGYILYHISIKYSGTSCTISVSSILVHPVLYQYQVFWYTLYYISIKYSGTFCISINTPCTISVCALELIINENRLIWKCETNMAQNSRGDTRVVTPPLPLLSQSLNPTLPLSPVFCILYRTVGY